MYPLPQSDHGNSKTLTTSPIYNQNMSQILQSTNTVSDVTHSIINSQIDGASNSDIQDFQNINDHSKVLLKNRSAPKKISPKNHRYFFQ